MFKLRLYISIFFFSISPQLRANSAAAFYDAALFDRAITAYQELVQEEVVDETQLKLAESYFQHKDFHSAADVLEKIPDHPRALLLLGMTYLQIEDYVRAAQVFSKVDHPEGCFYKGVALFKAKELAHARIAFESVPFSLAQLYLARIDMKDGDFRSAKRRLDLLPQDSSLAYEIAYLQGEVAFHLRDFSQAINAFEKAFPKHHPEKTDWYQDALYYLGLSCLNAAEEDFRSKKEQILFFEKAEAAFKHFPKNERFVLALGQTYLAKAYRLKDAFYYAEAENQLAKDDLFLSMESKMQALLLRAQAATTFVGRDKLYRQLTSENQNYAKGWCLRGMNNFEEGECLKDQGKTEESLAAFQKAVEALDKAFQLAATENKELAATALKFQAQAYAKQSSRQGFSNSLEILNRLIDPVYLSVLDHPDEVFYLRALVASHLANAPLALEFVKEGIEKYPEGSFTDFLLHLQATLLWQQKNYEEAFQAFLFLAETFPNSQKAGESLFFAAKCVEILHPQEIEKIRALRKRVYESYPESPYAAEAYFTLYSYRDYLHGDRAAVKHLQAFSVHYPESPFLLNANYLLGMDYKHDRKDAEGRWIRKKNLLESIDHFQSVESIFDTLHEKGKLSSNFEYYVTLRYRSSLERALANLSIAEGSQGAKSEIYLEYAQDLFKQIIDDFKKNTSLTRILKNREPYPGIQEESEFNLAKSYVKFGHDVAASLILNEMIDRYASAKITRGYYLCRVRSEQSAIAMRKGDYEQALYLLNLAEDSAKGKILPSEQKLDLWIHQSICLRALGHLDDAILILSKAINDDAVSGLRLKAMYLRAEIYEQQGRRELARRQLESTSKKGGEWAAKAKTKLEENYAY